MKGLKPVDVVVRWWVVLLSVALGCGVGVGGTVQFSRDVRPVLAENCLACHGPDAEARKAGLRLDTREGLLGAGEKRGPVVVAGEAGKSELWKRLVTEDEEDLMPPPESHKVLTGEQKETVRRWIEEGAEWQGHWSFVTPVRPEVPRVKGAGWVRNPVDAFILAKLEAEGLEPAPEAGSRELLRRVSLDLTGLPPGPERVERWEKERRKDAYEREVRRLMGLPAYGEHRARYWLDAARYADTHGLHFDNYREIWPYRDWVIGAFNRNMPFDEFVVEQLAGDLLEGATEEQVVATGFQRCNLSTHEGGTIEEENLTMYANDRVTTTGWVFLGLTMNCAACHDHKFDPVTTKDFYSLAAFYRNTKEGGFDFNWREGDQSMVVPQTERDRRRWRELPGELEWAAKAMEAAAREADEGYTNWVLSGGAGGGGGGRRELGGERVWVPLVEGRGTNVAGWVAGKRREFVGPGKLDWRGGVLGAAPVLTRSNHFELGDEGRLGIKQALSVAAWVWVPEEFKGGGAVLARMEGEGDKVKGWELYIRDGTFGLQLVSDQRATALRVRGPEKALKKGRWQHLAATYDGGLRAKGVRLLLDGMEVEGANESDRLDGSMACAGPLRLGRRGVGEELDGVAVQDVRLYERKLGLEEVAVLAAGPRVADYLAQVEFGTTNNPARELMRRYYRATEHRGWSKAASEWREREDERLAIRERSPGTLVQREKTNSEPSAHVLFRGQYDQPREKVGAGTPAVLPPMTASMPRNRLGLARWLVSEENPLLARVTVNRLWQEVFGVGLVKTSEDFGVTGEAPSHPELLDWLAVEFRESGWDVRHMLELMVTSAAYRQSSVVTAAKLERDRENRWLSRGPRFRMDGEMLRDYALAAGGLLSPRVGGASVQPYHPGGVWEAVAMPESNTRVHVRGRGEELYRRSVYTFWKRAAPPASLEILNAPSREVCVVRRERTDTPLQALVTLNDPQFVEAARVAAERAWLEGRGRPEAVVESLARRVLCRPLREQERGVVMGAWTAMRAHYEKSPGDAADLVGVGEWGRSDRVSDVELAAWTLVANQLLNMDEVLNK